MALSRYSLSDYTLTITSNESDLSGSGAINGLQIGGVQSYIGEISIDLNEEAFTTEGDATGGWVHSFSRNRTGTITVNLRFVNENVKKLIYLLNLYYSSTEAFKGINITISSRNGTLATANDCYVQKVPNFRLEDEAQDLDFEFTCGEIVFEGSVV